MLTFGWGEILLVLVVVIVVVGPKDLPKLIKQFSTFAKSLKKLSREFKYSLNEIADQEEFKEINKTIMEAKKSIIINPIDAHLLSSPSISSKIKVVAIPAIIPKAIRIQNNLDNFLSFSFLATSLIGGSLEGSLELVGVISDFSISGVSISSAILGLESLDPGVGADFFFLNLAKLNF